MRRALDDFSGNRNRLERDIAIALPTWILKLNDIEDDESDETDQGDDIGSLTDVMDRLDDAANSDETVSMADVVDEIGRTSFVPLLLTGGVIMGAPVIGVVPGVPTFAGFCIGLVAGQMVFGRERIWLPQWIENRTIKSDKVASAVSWLRRPAAWIDHVTKPRMQWLVHGVFGKIIVVACLIIALAGPVMELVPMSANIAGATIVLFALSLLVGDGFVGLIAMVAVLGLTSLMLKHFLG